MTQTTVVKTIEGLYDEKAEAKLYSINARTLCIGAHRWVNASLHWQGEKRKDGSYCDITFESEKNRYGGAEWGFGYGGIRFCSKCKHIDCIHHWEAQIVYRVERSKFYAEMYSVDTCLTCARRILRSSYGSCEPSAEAHSIIVDAAEACGKPVPGLGGGYGSGWMCEFPVAVSDVLDSQGHDAALRYAISTFMNGDCSDAMRIHLR